MDGNALNWRGVMVFGLAVLTAIVLIAVIDDEPAPLGINTATDSSATSSTLATTTTTLAGTATTAATGSSTATTKPGTATSTTKPGTTATTSFNPAGKPLLKLGSTGPDVVFLQDKLRTLGYYTGASDGSFGPGTKDAVVKFQTAKAIAPADGEVGPATWTALSTA